MKQEQEDWKPEVGKTAWVLDPRHARVIEVNVVKVLEPMITISHPSSYVSWSEGWHYAYPTAEAALASIEVVYLNGKEVSNGK